MTEVVLPRAAQAVLHWARREPRRLAVIDGAARIGYRDLALQIARFARALREAGLLPGMLVGLQTGNRFLGLVLALGCEVVGATHVSLTAPELDEDNALMRHLDLLVAQAPGARLANGAPVVALSQPWLDAAAAGALGEAEIAAIGMDWPDEAGVRIGKTSGTTGAPKYMLKSWAMLRAIIASYDAAYRPVAGDYRYLCLYGVTMGGVYIDLVRALIHGNAIQFVADLGWAAQPEGLENCYAFLLLREAEALVRHGAALPRPLGLHYIDVVGGRLAPAFLAELAARISPHVLNVYSSNEAASLAAVHPDGTATPLPGVEIRIVDAALRPLPVGETGTIMVRTPWLIAGYLWDPELTARHFHAGWFLTSDLGYLTAEGKLVVLGRADEMLNIGGVKLPPHAIEAALKALPGVIEAVLLRQEDTRGIGRLQVVVERDDPSIDGGLRADILRVLERYSATGAVHFAKALPRTETGKVQRHLLRRIIDGGASMKPR